VRIDIETKALSVGIGTAGLLAALLIAAPPALAEDRRLAPYRMVPGALLPGWPSGGRAHDWVVDPVVVLGEALACCDPTSSWLRT